MKTQISTFATACIALFGFVGCNSYSSPQAVIHTAGKALKENNVEIFRSTLTEDMAAQYGNSAEMDKLKETLAPFSDLSADKGTVLAARQDTFRICNPAGWHHVESVDVHRTYEVMISGKDASATVTPVITATVDCAIEYEEVSTHKGGLCYERNGQFCQISALK